MLTMIGKRLMFAIPSLIGVVIVTFLLTRALPGDPAAYFAGPAATKEAVEQIRKKLGFDKPLIEQFFRYTADLAHGDFGNSLPTARARGSTISAGSPPRPGSRCRCSSPVWCSSTFSISGSAGPRRRSAGSMYSTAPHRR